MYSLTILAGAPAGVKRDETWSGPLSPDPSPEKGGVTRGNLSRVWLPFPTTKGSRGVRSVGAQSVASVVLRRSIVSPDSIPVDEI